jgi:hypothetical protein
VIGKLLVLGASGDLAGRYLLGPQVLHAMVVDAPVRAPLVDDALRAAATSGATVRLLANQFPDGAGPPAESGRCCGTPGGPATAEPAALPARGRRRRGTNLLCLAPLPQRGAGRQIRWRLLLEGCRPVSSNSKVSQSWTRTTPRSPRSGGP